MHSLLEEGWGQDLIHFAYWEVNLRAVRLQLQRQNGEFEEMTGRRNRRGGESAVEDCEARRDQSSVKQRDEILYEKNEQNVSEQIGMEYGAREWRGRFAMEKSVDCFPEVSRVGRAGVNE